jgi:tight adherence protein B
MEKDYKKYVFSRREWMGSILEGMALNGLVAWLFYDTWIAMIPGGVLVFFYIREKKRVLIQRRRERLRKDLKEFFGALIAALQTGRSIENGFVEALKDLKRYSGEETDLVEELKRICAGIGVGESLEKQLGDFADRSHLEELEYFAEVFSVAKRSGGNIVGIMKNTLRMLQERMEAEAEIRTVLAEKQMEFYIMCVIPLGMMFYLRISAGNLVNCLYGTFTGVIVMTCCLGIYGGCILYGKRLLEINGG